MKVFVLGAGQMGSGIAQCCAQAGYETILSDTAAAALEKGMTYIAGNLQRNVDKGRITAERKDEVLSALEANGLKLIKATNRRGWNALIMK